MAMARFRPSDMVDFVVARVLDQLRIPNELAPRWGRERDAGGGAGGDTEC